MHSTRYRQQTMACRSWGPRQSSNHPDRLQLRQLPQPFGDFGLLLLHCTKRAILQCIGTMVHTVKSMHYTKRRACALCASAAVLNAADKTSRYLDRSVCDWMQATTKMLHAHVQSTSHAIGHLVKLHLNCQAVHARFNNFLDGIAFRQGSQQHVGQMGRCAHISSHSAKWKIVMHRLPGI